ncbi:MAG: hypothetical protein Q8Q49_02490 [bacterium]|nr:hypothetical protein [bacterium]
MEKLNSRLTTQPRSPVTSIADFFGGHAFYRHTLFFLLSLLVIGITGYYFGTFDQSIHIPFLKKEVNPALFPNDPFFELRKTHYSYFWFLFRPFLQLGFLEVSLFVVHVFSTYLTFWALWRLSKTLFGSNTVAFLVVIAFSFPHLGFAAFPVFEFSLLNRTFALPFLLFGVDWYLQRKYVRSFLLLGLVNNLHALSVNFVMLMIGVDLLFRVWQERWQTRQKGQIAVGFFVFFLASLPVLLWKFGKSPLDFTLRPEWFSILSHSLMYTVFYPLSTFPTVLLLTTCGVSAFLLYFVMTKYQKLSVHAPVITHFMYAAIFLVGLEVIVSEWLPVTFLVQFQIIRISILSFIFCYVFFVASLVKKFQEGEISRNQFHMQFLSLFLSVTAIVPLLVAFLMRILPKRDRIIAGYATIATSFVVFAVLAWQMNVWRPGVHVFPQKTDWYDVQVWARDTTPTDAMFMTPPEKWWLFEPDWRVYSERSTLVTLSEVLEFAFTPEYTDSWKKRFDILAPGAREQFGEDLLESIRLTRDAYDRIPEENLREVAAKYRVSYIVVAKPRTLGLSLVYQNASFSVYKLQTLYARLQAQ